MSHRVEQERESLAVEEELYVSETWPAPSQQPKRPVRRQERSYANLKSTDVIEWLALNKPQCFEDLMDLRKTLYSRIHNFGKYFITGRGHTAKGEEKFVLNGPGGSVLILSNKCRHFLLRRLCQLRRLEGWPPIVY